MRFSRWNEGEKTYMMLCKISLCKRIAALVTGAIIWEEKEMPRPRKPTRNEKIWLSKLGYDSKKYHVLYDLPEYLVVLEKGGVNPEYVKNEEKRK